MDCAVCARAIESVVCVACIRRRQVSLLEDRRAAVARVQALTERIESLQPGPRRTASAQLAPGRERLARCKARVKALQRSVYEERQRNNALKLQCRKKELYLERAEERLEALRVKLEKRANVAAARERLGDDTEALVRVRKAVVHEALDIFRLKRLSTHVCTIVGIRLPMRDSDFPRAEAVAAKPESIAAGVGYATLLTLLLAQYLCVGLPNAVVYTGSRSYIEDDEPAVEEPERSPTPTSSLSSMVLGSSPSGGDGAPPPGYLPLFYESSCTDEFMRAIALLSNNVAYLCTTFGMRLTPLDSSAMMQNLVRLMHGLQKGHASTEDEETVAAAAAEDLHGLGGEETIFTTTGVIRAGSPLATAAVGAVQPRTSVDESDSDDGFGILPDGTMIAEAGDSSLSSDSDNWDFIERPLAPPPSHDDDLSMFEREVFRDGQ